MRRGHNTLLLYPVVSGFHLMRVYLLRQDPGTGPACDKRVWAGRLRFQTVTRQHRAIASASLGQKN